MSELLVSVIVPVYNNPAGLKQLTQALLDQNIASDIFEIILVDNGSTDETPQVGREFQLENPKRIKFFIEKNNRSSYAARNLGIRNACGEIIAMIDSDCVPGPQWIKEGMRVLNRDGVDLVGGKVSFVYSEDKTSSEIFDSLIHLNVEYYIKTLGSTITANLFAHKRVFETIGLFPNKARSGEDMLWTKRATHGGFNLEYSPQAEVFHPARKFVPLLKKMYRVGYSQPLIWLDQDVPWYRIIVWSINDSRPLTLRGIRKLISDRGSPDMLGKLLSIWFVAWVCRLVVVFGRFVFALNSIKRQVLRSA